MLAWRHGNPAGAVEAVRFCGEQRRPLPDAIWRWVVSVLEDYVRTLPAPAPAPRKGRYARLSNVNAQHRQNVRCWRALSAARVRLKGAVATEAAAKDLATRGIHLGPKAIENGFHEIERWLQFDRPDRLRVIQRLYPDDEADA